MSPGNERSRSRSPNRMETDNTTNAMWKCGNCETENNSINVKCRNCGLHIHGDKSKVFKDDWECPSCKGNNYSRRLDCFRCHQAKPTINKKHPNDWSCSECNSNNFSRRVDCFKCKAPKPEFVSSRGSEWACPCGFINFSLRVSCYKCGLAKEERDRRFRDGYGFDSNYGYDNYSPRRPTPERPVRPRAPITKPVPGYYPRYEGDIYSPRLRSVTPERPFRSRSPVSAPVPDVDPVTGESEWMCPVCGIANFYKRPDCFRCFEVKPGTYEAFQHDYQQEAPLEPHSYYQSPRTGMRFPPNYREAHKMPVERGPPRHHTLPPRPQKLYPADWVCDQCHGLNFSKRVDCFKCHTAKPEIERHGDNKYPNDWICQQCGGNNFSRRINCFKCKTPKHDGQQNNVEVAS